MIMKPLLSFCLFAASLALGQTVMAQSPAITSTLTAQRVEMVEGKAVLKPAAQGKPGDVIEYSGTYHNTSAGAVAKLQAIVPVPPGTTYVADSARPAQVQASVDGASFAPVPLMRTVKQPDGRERKEPVPLAEYRALRWDIGTLAAGAKSLVSLRVSIDSSGSSAGAKPK
jgi:uncharacterized repeat protein (TIGR01451 family)